MLQMMENKVTAEGKKAKEVYDAFMCYCDGNGAALGKSITDSETKIPQLKSSIKESTALKAQLDAEIIAHQGDRAAAKDAIAKANGIRDKEAATFATVSANLQANIAALTKAMAAISKGMSGFLQTGAATVLRNLVMSLDSLSTSDRDMLA